MEKIKNYYEEHKKQISLGFLILIVLTITTLIFMNINNKYNSENTNEKEIIAVSEEKNINNETPNTSTIKVDIKGYIENPGVYELYENSRVIDAIEKAGGLKENAYTRYINLSQKLEDENVIIINSVEEIEEAKKGEKEKNICEKFNDICIKDEKIITNRTYETNSNEEIKTGTEKDKETLNTLVNINEADAKTLMTLNGIGESKALKIIEYREANGNFKTKEEIMNVSGIGTSVYEKIKDSITI